MSVFSKVKGKEMCHLCKPGVDHGKCASCGDPLVLVCIGELEESDGSTSHVCAVDCPRKHRY